MIIQLRGTSGSGKSTVVQAIMDDATQRLRVREAGRKQPIGYILTVPWANGRIAVPGHYETACGGCDTIPSMDKVFEKVETGRMCEPHVLFEGLLASEEVRRTVALHERFPGQLRVLLLTTPVEQCLEGIRDRRAARGDERPLKEDNTRNRVKVINRACERLTQAGVTVIRTNRDDALALVREMLCG